MSASAAATFNRRVTGIDVAPPVTPRRSERRRTTPQPQRELRVSTGLNSGSEPTSSMFLSTKGGRGSNRVTEVLIGRERDGPGHDGLTADVAKSLALGWGDVRPAPSTSDRCP